MTASSGALIIEGDDIRLDRTVTLQFRGDWGQANLTRVCGWLAQEVGDRTRPDSRFGIWNGRGGPDQTNALMAGEVDVAVMTPRAGARLVYDGAAVIGVPAQPNLRALGSIPHRDRLVIAVDAALPVHSAAELPSVADRLTIATCPDDGTNMVGRSAHHALRLAGADPEKLVSSGARFVYDERPYPSLEAFTDGAANVLIHEAVMTPRWNHIADQRPVRYLDWGADVFDGFAQIGWDDATVEAGYLPGLEQDLRTLDFSDFVLVCRDDLDADIAYLLAWCMVRTRDALEIQYAHLPQGRSPVTVPIDPAQMRLTPVPLHPAAERAYDDLGVE